MTMTTHTVWLRLSNGSTTQVVMSADSSNDCRMMCEAQYGSGSYISSSILVSREQALANEMKKNEGRAWWE
jgi:hypothetical protein